MKLEITCAMCGKEREIDIETFRLDPETSLRKVIEEYGWITQQNGEHFDIYCSKRCAS